MNLEKKSLANKVATIKSTFLGYVDTETLNYYKTQLVMDNPDLYNDLDYREVKLSKKQREDAIAELQWFKRDIEACIAHLEIK
jgi:hypothetical protein